MIHYYLYHVYNLKTNVPFINTVLTLFSQTRISYIQVTITKPIRNPAMSKKNDKNDG